MTVTRAPWPGCFPRPIGGRHGYRTARDRGERRYGRLRGRLILGRAPDPRGDKKETENIASETAVYQETETVPKPL